MKKRCRRMIRKVINAVVVLSAVLPSTTLDAAEHSDSRAELQSQIDSLRAEAAYSEAAAVARRLL
ncbi:MAG: hypothetical protein ACYS8K_10860, partial [Planctomycetota bacterium]